MSSSSLYDYQKHQAQNAGQPTPQGAWYELNSPASALNVLNPTAFIRLGIIIFVAAMGFIALTRVFPSVGDTASSVAQLAKGE